METWIEALRLREWLFGDGRPLSIARIVQCPSLPLSGYGATACVDSLQAHAASPTPNIWQVCREIQIDLVPFEMAAVTGIRIRSAVTTAGLTWRVNLDRRVSSSLDPGRGRPGPLNTRRGNSGALNS